MKAKKVIQKNKADNRTDIICCESKKIIKKNKADNRTDIICLWKRKKFFCKIKRTIGQGNPFVKLSPCKPFTLLASPYGNIQLVHKESLSVRCQVPLHPDWHSVSTPKDNL